MKRPVVLYIAVSLDRYIARENGEIVWLYESEGEPSAHVTFVTHWRCTRVYRESERTERF